MCVWYTAHASTTIAILAHDFFSDEEVASLTTGAGIVPIAWHAGEPHVLLAKEHTVPNWKGSQKWSAFEGGRKTGETVDEAALRECSEESLGVLDAEVDAETLRANRYVCRFVLHVSQRPRAGRFHVCYFCEVAHDDTLPTEFARRRDALLLVRERAAAMATAAKEAFGSVAPADVRDDGVVLLADGSLVDTDASREWMRLANETEMALLSAREEAVSVRRGSTADCLLEARVLPDHMEKSELRWWTLSSLRSVLARGGVAGEEGFRAYFLPVLAGVVEFFERDGVWKTSASHPL